jgi:hypothetical protein
MFWWAIGRGYALVKPPKIWKKELEYSPWREDERENIIPE